MKPTIYNPSVYNAQTIYNTGAGGGGGGFPEGYTKYDWIKLNENQTIGGNTGRFFWLPINNAVNNDGALFLVEYEVKLNAYQNSSLLTTMNNPGGSLSSGNIELALRRIDDTYGGFHHVDNTVYSGIVKNKALGIVWGHNTMTLQNGTITCNDNVIYNDSNIFQKVSIEGKYITTITDKSSLNQKIYNVQIKRGNAIIYNYVPCKRDLDGVFGFIDIVNNVFVRSAEHNENTYYVVGND